MLNPNDLAQIGKIVKTELAPVKKDLETVKNDVSTLKNDTTSLKNDVAALKKDATTLKKDSKKTYREIKKIRQDQNTIIGFFDEKYLDLNKRVENLEQVPNTPTNS